MGTKGSIVGAHSVEEFISKLKKPRRKGYEIELPFVYINNESAGYKIEFPFAYINSQLNGRTGTYPQVR